MSESKTPEEPTQARLDRLEAKRKTEAAEARAAAEASDGLFQRPTVTYREVFGATTKVELIEYEAAAECNGTVLLGGVPSANMTPLLAAGYFAKQLELPTVACFRVHGGAPEGIVMKNTPGLQIRLVGNSRVACLLSEKPLKGGGLVYNLLQAVLAFCRRHSVRHVLAVDGVPTPPDQMEDAPTLRFCTTSERLSAQLKADGHSAINNAIVPGFAGQLLADAALSDGTQGMDVSALLVKADARLPSAKPAVHVVRALNAFFDDLNVSLEDLEDSALEMESAIRKVLDEAKAKMAPKEAPGHMYM